MYRYNENQPALLPSGRTGLALGVTLLLWSSAFPGIRVGLEAFAPAHLALLRFLVASVVLLAWAMASSIRMPEARDLPMIMLSGAIGITLYHVLLNSGELTVSAGAASLVASMVPVFTIILASVALGERMAGGAWFGLATCVFGVVLISVGDSSGVTFDPGVLLILAAALGQATYFILQKRFIPKYGALPFAAYTIWAGTALLLVFAPGLGTAIAQASPAEVGAVVYLGVFPAAIAYLTWSHVLGSWSASAASSTLFAVPVLSTAIAWVWIGERPTLISLVGGAISLTGLAMLRECRMSGSLWARFPWPARARCEN